MTPPVVHERLSPKQGKGIWIGLIVSGILLAIPIVVEFRGEAGALWLLAMLGLIYPLYRAWQWWHYRDRRRQP